MTDAAANGFTRSERAARLRGRARCGRASLILAVAMCAPAALAGEWHAAGTLGCTDCHTMHNSRNGLPMRYDEVGAPNRQLLRAETVTSLCLACHRSANPTSHAPPVDVPGNGEPPGGGFPADLSDPTHHAHNLDGEAVMPPSGDTAVVMTCATCHAPHGNGAYRNLVASPSGTGRSTSAPVVAQLVTADGTNAASVYVRANVRYVSGMSSWCMDCHNGLTAAHSQGGTVPAHPWDRPIFGAAQADWAAWSGAVPERVGVENPGGFAVPLPNEGDQVFCLSCHKAHGSPNPSTLVYADGVTQSSTCQQCHNM